MLPYSDRGGHRTARIMMRYSLLLIPVGAAAVATGIATSPFAVEAALGGAFITTFAAKFATERSRAAARIVFLRSLFYMPLMCIAAVAHRVPQEEVSY